MSAMKLLSSAMLVAVAAAGDCDGLDTGRFCVAGNSTAFVYCPQDIQLVCGATTFCKQTKDTDISCNVPKYCPSLATEAGSYCMDDDETSFYSCPEPSTPGQEATKCGEGLKCHQKTATTTECIPADTCADKTGGYFCSYTDTNKYYSCPGFAQQACPRGLECTQPSTGQIACEYPKSELASFIDGPKNCQEMGSTTSCVDIDAHSYCGTSDDDAAVFGDGTGCSCKWGFTYNKDTGACEGTAPPVVGDNYCGADWKDATSCSQKCDENLQCPGEAKCFASIECPAPAPVEQQKLGGAATAKDCNDGTYFATFTDVQVTPNISKNEKATLTASGTLNKPVTSGQYKVDVKYAGASLYSHTGDVCVDESVTLPLNVGTIQLHGMGCPANPGPVSYGLDVTLPTIAPNGAYTITLTSTDQDSGNLFCIEADLKL